MRFDGLGLEVTGQHIKSDRIVLACRIASNDRWCRHCRCQDALRDTIVRHPAHEPYGWRPTILHVAVSPLPVPDVCSRVGSRYEPSG